MVNVPEGLDQVILRKVGGLIEHVLLTNVLLIGEFI